MFCVKKSLRIAILYLVYIEEEEKRNEEYRVQVKLGQL